MKEISISLGEDEALVLFELLHRWELSGTLEVQDASERGALEALQAAFERTLVAPMKADYDTLVDAAKASVRHRWGD